jgi:hypothetical protein
MEAGVEETEENNVILFAFGMIILHRSLFPSMSILSLFVFALFVYSTPSSKSFDFIVGKYSI